MGTPYYKLKWPITHAEVEEGVTHDVVKLWDRGGPIGMLTMLAGHSAPFMQMLIDKGNSVARTWYGGERSGIRIDIDPTLHDGTVLIAETGHITTVGELRKQAGRRER